MPHDQQRLARGVGVRWSFRDKGKKGAAGRSGCSRQSLHSFLDNRFDTGFGSGDHRVNRVLMMGKIR